MPASIVVEFSEVATAPMFLVDYLRSIVLPLVDAEHASAIEVQALTGGDEGEIRLSVVGPGPAVRMLLGAGGRNADALRLLVRARARAGGCRARIDVWVGDANYQRPGAS